MGLLYRVLVGSQLGPTEYGIISVMMTIFSAATTIAFFGVPHGIQKFVAEYRGKEQPGKIHGTLKAGSHLLLITSVLTAALVFLFSRPLSLFLNEPNAVIPIRIVAIAIPFMAFTQLFINAWEAYEKMEYTVYTLQLGNNIVKIILATVLIYIGLNYYGAALAFAIAFVFSGILGYYLYRKAIPSSVFASEPSHNYKELFQHSWPLLGASMISIITGNIDTFMIQKFIGTTSTGFYNAAYPFAALLPAIGGTFGSIFLSNSSIIGKENKSLNRDLYRTVVKWSMLIAFPVFLILFTFPGHVLTIFGREFAGIEIQNTLRVLSIGFLLTSLVGPSAQIYQSYGRTKLNLISSALLASSNMVLNYILILSMGILGASAASTISFGILFIFNLYFLRRIADIQPIKLSTVKIIISGALAVTAVYLVSNLLFEVTPSWFLIPIGLLYGIIYLSLLFILKSLEEDDLMIFKALESKFGFKSKRIEKLLEKAV